MDYRFLAANPAFERMTGLSSAQVVGRTVLEVLPGTEPHWIDTYGKVALTGQPASFDAYSKEVGKHFEVTAFCPTPSQFATIFQDTTERKQMEVRLQQAQKMEAIGALAGGIAHDFNNILFPITGMSEMLLDDFDAGSPQHENLMMIYNAALRAKELVNQILSFSRQTQQQKVAMRLQPIINEVIKLARSTIPSNIVIRQNIQTDCGTVLADPTHLHQVAMNLVTNAYHAVEQNGGSITVELRQLQLSQDDAALSALTPGAYALMSVTDTGHGISPDAMPKIFDPYFTTKPQGKGTGLGLSVCYGIVKISAGTSRCIVKLAKAPFSMFTCPCWVVMKKPKPQSTPIYCLPARSEF
jgi:PAS domain S-box-containing protein